jgi:hypothetical protein
MYLQVQSSLVNALNAASQQQPDGLDFLKDPDPEEVRISNGAWP